MWYSSQYTLDAMAETTLFALHIASSSWTKIEKHFSAFLRAKLEAYNQVLANRNVSTSDVSPLVQGMKETVYLTIFFFPCHSNIGQYVVREVLDGESLDP